MRAVYPWATITHADLDPEAVDFCSKAFGTQGVYSDPDFGKIEFHDDGADFDLIWVGSLITHLPEARSKELLQSLTDWLSQGGVGVITTHGSWVADQFRSGTHPSLKSFEETASVNDELILPYESSGYGHLNYLRQTEYGIPLTDLTWFKALEKEIGFRVVDFRPQGWDAHQDIISIRKL